MGGTGPNSGIGARETNAVFTNEADGSIFICVQKTIWFQRLNNYLVEFFNLNRSRTDAKGDPDRTSHDFFESLCLLSRFQR